MPRKPNYAVPALEKGLDILESLANSPAPLALGELARVLRRNSSELFRMCNCLEARGYVEREASSGKYALTLRLYELAHAHSPVDHLLKAAHGPMQAFSEDTLESCHLSILNRDALLVIAQSDSPSKVRLSIEVGARFDLMHTASGRLLLAQLSEDARGDLLDRLGTWRSMAPAMQKKISRQLTEIAKAGECSAENETILGVSDVVVPVKGRSEGNTIAALACTSLLSGQRKRGHDNIIGKLHLAAAAITQKLGL